MGKKIFIAEKPSVAKEFANALQYNMRAKDGYLESEEAIVTWCVGHLVTMSYPEAYDERLRRWRFDMIPFIPEEFKYEVIAGVKKQFTIVSDLLNREDVDMIYVCTDSGREGEYIYRLVEQMAGVHDKQRKRVWIDSQTQEEILRGIREAKDLEAYDTLRDAAYLRAKEDYLMGINFSRALTLKYGPTVKDYLKREKCVISVGRVMTCVLGMIVQREREIRSFVKTPFYRVVGMFQWQEHEFSAEWKAVEGSAYYASPVLYKENGFKDKVYAQKLIEMLSTDTDGKACIEKVERKKETKNPPLLYNLAEVQNDCSKFLKISPDATLQIIQELYEKKLVTYPRTDARVLSTAVAKEIQKNISGLQRYVKLGNFATEILSVGHYKNLAKTRYVNDKQITDHYAIIPTGQGLQNLSGLSHVAQKVYDMIARRFLSIFYPAAVYQKISLTIRVKQESFFANFKQLVDPGHLKVASCAKTSTEPKKQGAEKNDPESEQSEQKCDEIFLQALQTVKKGTIVSVQGYEIKEGETSPPKRYTSGSIILTMENAGQFIEDEELRAQIKGSGIGTSATRAEILKKLVNIEYLSLNQKNQVLTPTLLGELIYEVVFTAVKPLLDPALTASWEKGLTMVAQGTITSAEYMQKLSDFVIRRTNYVKQTNAQSALYTQFCQVEAYHKKKQSDDVEKGSGFGRRKK